MTERDEFSVYWWDRDGNQHEEMRFVSAEAAVNAAARLTHGPASVFKIVKKVIITDGGDFTNFLWEDGVLIYPTKEMRNGGSLS